MPNFKEIWLNAYKSVKNEIQSKILKDFNKVREFAIKKGFTDETESSTECVKNILKFAEKCFVKELGIQDDKYDKSFSDVYWSQEVLSKFEKTNLIEPDMFFNIWWRFYDEYWRLFKTTLINSILAIEHLATKYSVDKSRIIFEFACPLREEHIIYTVFTEEDYESFGLNVELHTNEHPFENIALTRKCFDFKIEFYGHDSGYDEFIIDEDFEENGLLRGLNIIMNSWEKGFTLID